MAASLPFELHPHGGGGFVVFESQEAVALPLLALAKATLRGDGGRKMVLEFGQQHMVVLEGEGLGELFAHLLAGRVKTIRCGRHAACVVEKIQLAEL